MFERSVLSEKHDEKVVAIYASRLRDLSHFIQSGAKILDVGSGNGIFVSVAQRAEYTVSAMDKSTACVRHVRRMGIRAYSDLTKVPTDTYDAITLFDVIEHIPQPRTFIRAVRAKLRKNGILMITTPNNQGITAHMAPSYLTTGDGQYSGHVVLYAPVTLARLLRPGFDLLETKTDILLQWCHTKHILWNKALNKCVYLFLTPFMPFLFSQLRGDNIQIIARKNLKK
ncbi:MAG: class I SAM-dependent methyltransferase [Candidatus Gottesmanbacteria bacterium]|nr:class I SAM-dependent methyltransferase [Candidatus Gottesmanbacteria bacterium]